MSPSLEAGVVSAGIGGEAKGEVPMRGLQRANPLENPGWDKLVGSHPEASFFHGASWARVLHETYGHSPHYFCATTGGRLSALLPVMEVNSPLTGRRGVSLPFSDECPFLSDGSISTQDVFQEVVDFGRKRKWKYVECRGINGLSEIHSAPIIPSARSSGQRGAALISALPREQSLLGTPSLSFLGHTLAFADRDDRIFGRFDSSVRRAIRKAEKAKIQVEISQSFDTLRTYYSLHCKTRRKHGLPPQPPAFFRSIFNQVLSKGLGLVVVARHEGRPVAAAVFFHFDDKAIYKFGASEPAFQHLRGSNLVMWEAIKWYSGKGYVSLHFGRTSIANEGLRRFKLGFGTSEYGINYFKYDLRRKTFVMDRDKTYGWFNQFFRLLPPPLSRMVGKLLNQHMS